MSGIEYFAEIVRGLAGLFIVGIGAVWCGSQIRRAIRSAHRRSAAWRALHDIRSGRACQ